MVVCNWPAWFFFGCSSRRCVTRVVFIFEFVWFEQALRVSIHYLIRISLFLVGVVRKFLCSYEDTRILLELCFQLREKSVNMLFFRCSLKIDRICKEYGQWRNIRAYCDGSRPSHDHLQSNFTDSTTHIKVSSNKKVSLRRRQRRLKSSCLKPEFFKNLENSPKLESFILENHSFDIEMVSWYRFNGKSFV